MTTSLRILVVDDSKNIRQVIRRYISPEFHAEFSEAGNGEEAERTLQEQHLAGNPIDLIMLDWMMPKMSGFELLQKIRHTEVFANSPRVIMLTAETFSDQINACMKYGVSAYLTKPFTEQELNQAIQKVLDAKELKYAV